MDNRRSALMQEVHALGNIWRRTQASQRRTQRGRGGERRTQGNLDTHRPGELVVRLVEEAVQITGRQELRHQTEGRDTEARKLQSTREAISARARKRARRYQTEVGVAQTSHEQRFVSELLELCQQLLVVVVLLLGTLALCIRSCQSLPTTRKERCNVPGEKLTFLTATTWSL
jgi:hypothetical protein